MKKIRVTLSLVFLAALSACSGSMEVESTGEDPAVQAPAVPAAPEAETGDDFRQRFVRWSEFAGVEPNFDESLQALSELRDRDCCRNAEDLQAYLNSFAGKDRPTQRLLEAMREENGALLRAFECLKFGTSFGQECPSRRDTAFEVVQVEELKRRIDKLSALAEEARERFAVSARILGFDLKPVESLPSSLEVEFAARFNDSIDGVLDDHPELAERAAELRVDGRLLRAVSFQLESGDFSFFEFIDRVTVLGETGRGGLRVVPAAENPALPTLLLRPVNNGNNVPIRP